MTKIPELGDGEAWRDLFMQVRDETELSDESLSGLVNLIVGIERNLCVIKFKRGLGYTPPDDVVFEDSCKSYVRRLYDEIQRRDNFSEDCDNI